MQLIGLTGGIASGKSTIARRLAEHGAVHLDADQLARDVVAPGTPALAQIARRFGQGIITGDGELDRAALGALVFSDGSALEDLESIVHPAVQELTRRLIREAGERDPDAVVVYDVPLLVEAGVDHPWDLIVVADAPAEMRVERLMAHRGMSGADARARVRNQASDEERRAIADVIIDTSRSEEETLAAADALWERLTG
ncbi:MULTISPECIES: dephospho-CoA kinase [unclassified Leucobacter]|uniref:dephospho-CoA kinase n=1 Tax=unclassified Leucobacter TaxID=2621730 RepID=UPI00165E654C|nr:dephospho-CoA kinase [Leucobacter sp. CX169]MBC9926795.1 dephospho-CoA kinase [Leucobacter sp. cx-169]